MEVDVRKLTTSELNKLIEDINELKNRASRELMTFRAKTEIDRKIIKDYLNSGMTHKQVAELNGVSLSKVKKPSIILLVHFFYRIMMTLITTRLDQLRARLVVKTQNYNKL